MEEIYEIYYDKEADFLEVFVGEASECLATEIERGVFVRRDIKTRVVKSVGILDFKKRVETLKRVLSQLNIDVPLDIKMS